MALSKFQEFINESSEFDPINVDIVFESTAVAGSDVIWTDIVKTVFPTELDDILLSINSLKWEAASGSKPMSSALALKGVIKEFDMPGVDMVAFGGKPFGTKQEPTAAYSVFGAQAHYTNGTYRIFFVDGGSEVTPACAQRIKGVNESDASESVDMKNGILKFIEKFPKNASSWGDATDELVDLHFDLAEEFRVRVEEDEYKASDYDYDKYWSDAHSPTPAKRNTLHREGIERLLDVLKPEHIKDVYDKYQNWF